MKEFLHHCSLLSLKFLKAHCDMFPSNLSYTNSGPGAGEENEHELGKLATRLAASICLPMTLKSVIELNILEILAEAGAGVFLSATQISAKLPTKNPDAHILLDRMLRLLASHSILVCKVATGEDGEVCHLYGLGSLSKFFLKNEGAGSIAPLLLMFFDKVFMESWNHFNGAILEGGVPFDRLYGKSAFEYLGTDPRFNEVFNQAMSNFTALLMKKILDVYKGFEDVKALVDVGGGVGANVKLITSKYPNIKGINYDLPHVIASAQPIKGVEHVGGDMFANIPQGDAIFMKSVLHDWDDDRCLKILKNCYEALPNNGKVIIVEMLDPEIPENNDSAQMVYSLDVFVLTQINGGKERSERELQALAMESGFSSSKVICSAYYFSVLEFHKRDG